jgi:hypothetical protein
VDVRAGHKPPQFLAFLDEPHLVAESSLHFRKLRPVTGPGINAKLPLRRFDAKTYGMIQVFEMQENMRLGFPSVYLFITLQSDGRQIISTGANKLQIQNVTEQLGVISAHLLLAEQIYLFTAIAPDLLLPTIADDLRMPDD